METEYKQAISEVIEILNHSEKSIVERIPKKFIEFLYENMDKDYKVNIDFYSTNWEVSVKEETQAILAMIYRDYIVSPEERQKLIAEQKEEETRIEQELREKYNPDNIFSKIEPIKNEQPEPQTQLIEIKSEPWYKRIFVHILEILGIKK